VISPFGTRLKLGFLPQDLSEDEFKKYQFLNKIGALEQDREGLYRLNSLYRVGRLTLSKDGRGFVESDDSIRDLVVEGSDIGGAKDGDEVVVKRIIARRGRPSAKVVLITKHSSIKLIGYTAKDENGNLFIANIKNGQKIVDKIDGLDITHLKLGTLLLIDAFTLKLIEVLGHLNDARVDERISLLLYDRLDDNFSISAINQAKAIQSRVLESDIEGRRDLRELPFCTIDPVSAKDFDDAIYFDLESFTLYVAIADVSYYVEAFSPIDKEAKLRGFTTYFPHKAFPMLPKQLSENICSLKPNVDRLAFVAKIKLDRDTLKPLKEEFFEAVIHSKRRFNYDEVDAILEGKVDNFSDIERDILKWLLPLQKITLKLKAKRLKEGFDFRSDEIKITINEEHLLEDTKIETSTPSHSLIEECMLLANVASAKRFSGDGDAPFRIHEEPELEKIEALLEELATIGIFIENYDESRVDKIIRAIQKEAKAQNLESEVDELIIKSLKRASYSSFNVGHFGLGFKSYSHFTSPIRRYSDLLLHRLIKAELKGDSEQKSYLLRNIEPLCVELSQLERDATKAEWDFRDRKLTRWASSNIGEEFKAKVIEIDIEDENRGAKALLECDIDGVIVELDEYNAKLFDDIRVKITEANIAQARIKAKQVEEDV